jgi:hypothetical protein
VGKAVAKRNINISALLRPRRRRRRRRKRTKRGKNGA